MLMDRSCNELTSSISTNALQPCFVWSTFEADFLHEFCGPQLDKPFVNHGNEGRYAFELHIDFFNPEGMSLCSMHLSSSIISMACLNLPAEIRYRPENMYLAGVIPGPKQPSLKNLNHYL